LRRADQLQMVSNMIPSCKIVDGNGAIIASRDPNEGEGFVMAEVKLADQKPQPQASQPKSPVPALAFFNADVLVPWIMRSVYQKGRKRIISRRKA